MCFSVVVFSSFLGNLVRARFRADFWSREETSNQSLEAVCSLDYLPRYAYVAGRNVCHLLQRKSDNETNPNVHLLICLPPLSLICSIVLYVVHLLHRFVALVSQDLYNISVCNGSGRKGPVHLHQYRQGLALFERRRSSRTLRFDLLDVSVLKKGTTETHSPFV